jgi:hypothetical protein
MRISVIGCGWRTWRSLGVAVRIFSMSFGPAFSALRPPVALLSASTIRRDQPATIGVPYDIGISHRSGKRQTSNQRPLAEDPIAKIAAGAVMPRRTVYCTEHGQHTQHQEFISAGSVTRLLQYGFCLTRTP